MAKLIAAITVTISLVALGMANAHQTQVNYLVGEPVTIRVVVLVGVCYLAGALSAVLARLTRDARERRRIQQQARRRRSDGRRYLPVLEDDE